MTGRIPYLEVSPQQGAAFFGSPESGPVVKPGRHRQFPPAAKAHIAPHADKVIRLTSPSALADWRKANNLA